MNFMKYRWFYFLFSALFIVPGLISLALFGFKQSIDFTGGSLIELKVNPIYQPTKTEFSQAEFQSTLGSSYQIISMQKTAPLQYILRGKPIQNDQKNQLLQKLQDKYGLVKEVRFETVGPTLGKELLQKTLNAGMVVIIVIILYVWYQFRDMKYGIAAVLAMVHDALILLGSFSILGRLFGVEVDVLFVTALLTILSFSVHDTIIVFDRIRENVRKHPRVPYPEIINASILETVGRSINNSMTIIIMLLTLVLLGGQTTHWFAVALLIGAITGTYSSTFTAAPLLLVWDDLREKMIERKRQQALQRSSK